VLHFGVKLWERSSDPLGHMIFP